MNYRFRRIPKKEANQAPRLPSGKRRRYQLKGRTTLRGAKAPLPDPIEQISLFGEAQLPQGAKPPKRRPLHALGATLRRWASRLGKAWSKARTATLAWLRAHKKQPKQKTVHLLPVAAGALCAAILVFSLSTAGVLFGLFGRYGRAYTGVTVPNFVGQRPGEVLPNGEESPFNLVIQYETNPQIEAGLVISQSPPAGVIRRLYGKDAYCTVTLKVSEGQKAYTLQALEGLSYRDASLILKNQGVRVTLKEEYSESTPKGTVLGTEPQTGTELLENETVTLRVSLGKQILPVTVPELIGLTEAQATSLLRATGLEAGTVTYRSSSAPTGTVIAQEPTKGSKTDRGTPVAFTVSIGERYNLRTLPDLYGMSLEEATAKLREYGLVIGNTYPVANAAPKGTVITQSPIAGTPLTSEIVSVDVYISS